MDAMSAAERREAVALVDDAALGDWHVDEYRKPSGANGWEVFEGRGDDDPDANTMAECYEERVAAFIAAAPTLLRRYEATVQALEAENARLRAEQARADRPF